MGIGQKIGRSMALPLDRFFEAVLRLKDGVPYKARWKILGLCSCFAAHSGVEDPEPTVLNMLISRNPYCLVRV